MPEQENLILPENSKDTSINEVEKRVSIGSIVTYLIVEEREEDTVTIVSAIYKKDNINDPVITPETPLADALMYRKVGDKSKVDCPVPYTVEILNISDSNLEEY